jgi:hypothetical protein
MCDSAESAQEHKTGRACAFLALMTSSDDEELLRTP